MFQHFLSLATASPGSPAIIEAATGRVISRGELLAQANERAAKIEERKLITVQLPNGAEFVATILAAAKRRAVAVLVDRDASPAEVAAVRSHFGQAPPLPENAAIVKLTSGTTGKPRGIVTSEENLIEDCRNICASMHIGAEDVNFGTIPMSHSYGFSNLVMPLITQGTPVAISNDYLPQSILEACNRYGCTVLPGIPMMFEHLAAAGGTFNTVRTFISAGAPLSPSTSRKFRKRFGASIHSFYGCSECGGITYDREGDAVERGTVGPALDGVALATRGSRLIVESAAVALGYLHGPETFEPFERRKFITEDLVEMREGEIVLTGRTSDLINAAGKKVNPREIEQIILQIDGVRQVKVYGQPAGARGEVVAAAVVAEPEVTRDLIRDFCRARLSLHKVPRIVKLIERMPVDERGKITRSALAAL